MNDKEKARIIAEKILEKYYVEPSWSKGLSLFELLVAIILSQRTYWKNTRRALERLRERYRSPREIAESSIDEIAETIKPAGLYREKARIIRELAHMVVDKKIVLEEIVKLPYHEARKKLLSIKGVGLKTADVFLMLAAEHPIVPVDTHIARIAKRTGIVDEKAGYDEIRSILEEAVDPGKRRSLHLALIMFGRSICKPRNPQCNICPIRELCKYAQIRMV